ncbi:hypothetical protein EZS27_024429, partial [termite gut metagenome]
LRPRNDESAGKYKCTATTKGNKYLRSVFVQVAWAASRMKNSYDREKFNRLAMRKPRKKALIAIARKLLTVSWHVLHDKSPISGQVHWSICKRGHCCHHEVTRTENALFAEDGQIDGHERYSDWQLHE